ncbi:MAG: class Ib ribonucleoside-diphosphate reductase assembly flavoprotein NrdI [Erysipelotrichaceae bacterium]|nr:class Ib ribonucleoside-diphosphate reductase assembly flavoprotein NrdI [Erysipelotrichaceae bacterium]MDY5251244.1 class Ib ribonucleoside-diphosphate reductase assembly flavoprotein NrdI [Erysipelotrichaceae bacterium]
MKIVYASRTGNVESVINTLGISDALCISSGNESILEDYILFTYTDGYGDIPGEVEAFLNANSAHLKGVIASGDMGYGEAFCQSGDKIAETYNVPYLYHFENAGDANDIAKIQEILAQY